MRENYYLVVLDAFLSMAFLCSIFACGFSENMLLCVPRNESEVSLLADYRTKGWPLVDSPMPTLFYTAIYLLIVWLGPKYMRNRKPYRLTWALLVYNIAMAVLNFYIAYEVCFFF